jgi:hypothetical protein
MGGGLLQLVAYGAQDVYLTGNPQITFFKVVYRRHTNFAIESIQQTFNGSVDYGSRVTSTISRNGDLISRVYLVLKNQAVTNAVPYYGLRVIDNVEVEIGGQKIDKHYAEWMYIWNELSLPESKKEGYFKMVGGAGGSGSDLGTMYVPLEFWFCRNIGLALPLIGLQYHEVKININFQSQAKCVSSGDTYGKLEANLWVDYIYLDTDERRKFAQSSHEYLIEQLQFTGKETFGMKTKLNFNHPVKELVWFLTKEVNPVMADWFNFTNDASDQPTYTNYEGVKTTIGQSQSTRKNPIAQAKLVLNGNDRFSIRDGMYFNVVQPYQHHENIPHNTGINVYSFALKPEEHQPSGTLNMSRIDSASLDLTAATGLTMANYNLNVYAINYNVLRILSGMGGIAYSN